MLNCVFKPSLITFKWKHDNRCPYFARTSLPRWTKTMTFVATRISLYSFTNKKWPDWSELINYPHLRAQWCPRESIELDWLILNHVILLTSRATIICLRSKSKLENLDNAFKKNTFKKMKILWQFLKANNLCRRSTSSSQMSLILLVIKAFSRPSVKTINPKLEQSLNKIKNKTLFKQL